MSNLAIIPARGGSKRIPGKNIRHFFGKPVIVYAIQNAISSGLFEEVMVSTDDASIQKIALEAGATVPFLRSEHNASDNATTVSVLLEVLNAYEQIGRSFECGCCLYPVTPLTTTEQLQVGWQMLQTSNFDTVMPVVLFSFPIWRSVRRDGDTVQWIWPEHALTRSQDLAPTYHDAGQWYWFQSKVLLARQTLLTENTGSIILDEMQVQDVDNESDWILLEQKFRLRHA